MAPRTEAHNKAIGRGMKGKNTAPKSVYHRAAISASRRAPRPSPEWTRLYDAKLSNLILAGELAYEPPLPADYNNAQIFWDNIRVIRSGCWEWLGPFFLKDGYGRTWIRGKIDAAHRVAWMLVNEQEIPEGRIICHHCDNRICIRPDHLYAGTHQTNADDRVARGRGRSSKIT